METSEIHLYDWDRILNGNTPAIFLIEIVIRAIFLYTMLMVALRLMGKRMASRLTRNELAGIATLSAAIGMPMQTPDRGLLPTVVLVVFVVLMQRWIAARAAKDEAVEKKMIGKLSTVMTDGVLDMKELKKAGISRHRVLAVLRTSGVKQAGEVKRLYLEATGGFSLVQAEIPAPGMAVIPEWDEEFLQSMQRHDSTTVCNFCGNHSGIPFETCNNCGNTSTGPAYL